MKVYKYNWDWIIGIRKKSFIQALPIYVYNTSDMQQKQKGGFLFPVPFQLTNRIRLPALEWILSLLDIPKKNIYTM